MKKPKSTVSHSVNDKGISDFWDTHDVTDFWEQTKAVNFEVLITSETIYYAIEKDLSERVKTIAAKQGLSPDTLVNLWVQEKIQEIIPMDDKLKNKRFQTAKKH